MDIERQVEVAVVRALAGTFRVFEKDAEVVIQNQGNPEPRKSYAAVQLLSFDSQGQASKSGLADYSTPQAKEYAAQAYVATVQINFYGNDAASLGMLVHSQTKTSTAVRQIYLRNNLSPRTISNLRRTPQLRESTWIKSYALDLTVGFTVRTIQDVEWVDAITVNDVLIPLTR